MVVDVPAIEVNGVGPREDRQKIGTMVESVDTADLKFAARESVRVRLPVVPVFLIKSSAEAANERERMQRIRTCVDGPHATSDADRSGDQLPLLVIGGTYLAEGEPR